MFRSDGDLIVLEEFLRALSGESISSYHQRYKKMKKRIKLDDVQIRTELRPGDIGYVIYLHGDLYKKECNYGIEFETYVASGLAEFYKHYDGQRDRVWVCEYKNKIVGFLLLLHRGEAAQLRYFILKPKYRGIGLGNRLMNLYMDFLKEKEYKSSYLLTTDELPASAHLYKKFGFKLVGEKPSHSFGKEVVEQRYELVVD